MRVHISVWCVSVCVCFSAEQEVAGLWTGSEVSCGGGHTAGPILTVSVEGLSARGLALARSGLAGGGGAVGGVRAVAVVMTPPGVLLPWLPDAVLHVLLVLRAAEVGHVAGEGRGSWVEGEER